MLTKPRGTECFSNLCSKSPNPSAPFRNKRIDLTLELTLMKDSTRRNLKNPGTAGAHPTAGSIAQIHKKRKEKHEKE
jgi:hypothetical protein